MAKFDILYCSLRLAIGVFKFLSSKREMRIFYVYKNRTITVDCLKEKNKRGLCYFFLKHLWHES